MNPKCEGCGNLIGDDCKVLAYPATQHSRIGGCHMRTHNKTMALIDDKKLNPLKASKRSKRAKK